MSGRTVPRYPNKRKGSAGASGTAQPSLTGRTIRDQIVRQKIAQTRQILNIALLISHNAVFLTQTPQTRYARMGR
ncbi:hypothetical protein Caka_2875 [Coraliomargarita akajimensis DSM 45221]|uniref:Uncharacterized protein n=1 Tax=Coraliomargarita akajimensis (strain DSM 45221 / IAM 15411 / JCM 23193 / KCTC 12865 / 04OKA010-24) TaxID=583355 RepID=D5ER44_CORAD|nr:hypothetical protein Caka_2875 [Coraliomargarita akajimensis DSM 45221]